MLRTVTQICLAIRFTSQILTGAAQINVRDRHSHPLALLAQHRRSVLTGTKQAVNITRFKMNVVGLSASFHHAPLPQQLHLLHHHRQSQQLKHQVLPLGLLLVLKLALL